jgi:hypothetical protein
LQIEDVISRKVEEPPAHSLPRRRILATAAVTLAAGIAIATLPNRLLTHSVTGPPQAVRFAVLPSAENPLNIDSRATALSRDLAMSPDGKHLVYVGGSGGDRRLILREIDQLDAGPIGNITDASSPFFSPDGCCSRRFSAAASFCSDHRHPELGSGAEEMTTGERLAL